METTRKIPAAALHFDASTTVFAEAADGLRKFSGVAYAGGVITGHFYWGRVAFDLATTRFAERVPILIEHDRSQRAGFGRISGSRPPPPPAAAANAAPGAAAACAAASTRSIRPRGGWLRRGRP